MHSFRDHAEIEEIELITKVGPRFPCISDAYRALQKSFERNSRPALARHSRALAGGGQQPGAWVLLVQSIEAIYN